jgi:tetratricopeptide (TPR) repeat protein
MEIAEFYHSRGDADFAQGEYDQAIANYQQAIELHPQLATCINFDIAQAFYHRGVYSRRSSRSDR